MGAHKDARSRLLTLAVLQPHRPSAIRLPRAVRFDFLPSSFYFPLSPSASTDHPPPLYPSQTTREARLCPRRRLDRVQPRVKIPLDFSFTSSRRGTTSFSSTFPTSISTSHSLAAGGSRRSANRQNLRSFRRFSSPFFDHLFLFPFFRLHRRSLLRSVVLHLWNVRRIQPFRRARRSSSALFIVALGRSISDGEGRQMQAHREGRRGEGQL